MLPQALNCRFLYYEADLLYDTCYPKLGVMRGVA